MNGLISAHSGMRYIVLALIIIAVVNALMKGKKNEYTSGDRKLNLFAMIFVHIQILLGIVLYFMSAKVQFGENTMSNEIIRFFTVEHALMMIIAMILITIGHSKSKKGETPAKQHKAILIYYGITLLLIFVAIPWPFLRDVGANYF